MLINELAKKTGISVHTIRFYEKSGLISGHRDPKVKSNNYFHYDDVVVEKLELIRDAKSIGFTISEIAQLIVAWYDEQLSLEEKLKVLDGKLESIDEKITQLKAMRKQLKVFRKDIINGNC